MASKKNKNIVLIPKLSPEEEKKKREKEAAEAAIFLMAPIEEMMTELANAKTELESRKVQCRIRGFIRAICCQLTAAEKKNDHLKTLNIILETNFNALNEELLTSTALLRTREYIGTLEDITFPRWLHRVDLSRMWRWEIALRCEFTIDLKVINSRFKANNIDIQVICKLLARIYTDVSETIEHPTCGFDNLKEEEWSALLNGLHVQNDTEKDYMRLLLSPVTSQDISSVKPKAAKSSGVQLHYQTEDTQDVALSNIVIQIKYKHGVKDVTAKSVKGLLSKYGMQFHIIIQNGNHFQGYVYARFIRKSAQDIDTIIRVLQKQDNVDTAISLADDE